MQPSSNPEYYDTPETLFSISPNIEPGLPIDAINCAIGRAQAVLVFVMSQFDGTTDAKFSNEVIGNALWAVAGDLKMIHKMTDFAWRQQE